jgi:osmoprotectant transport system permease protein
MSELNTWLKPLGLKVAIPLGFNNMYTLAINDNELMPAGAIPAAILALLAQCILTPKQNPAKI